LQGPDRATTTRVVRSRLPHLPRRGHAMPSAHLAAWSTLRGASTPGPAEVLFGRGPQATAREGGWNYGGETSCRGRSDVVMVAANCVVDQALAQLVEGDARGTCGVGQQGQLGQ